MKQASKINLKQVVGKTEAIPWGVLRILSFLNSYINLWIIFPRDPTFPRKTTLEFRRNDGFRGSSED